MVIRNREKVAARGVAEPCGGGDIGVGSVLDDGAPSLMEPELGAEPDAGWEAEVEGEGPSAGALCGAGGEVEEGALWGAGDEEPVAVTLMLSFWPLLQWPDKVHEK